MKHDLPPGYLPCTILAKVGVPDPDNGKSLIREVMEDDPSQSYILFDGPAELSITVHSERITITSTGKESSLHRGHVRELHAMLGKILEREDFLDGKIMT